jgi:hypothetical protein
VDGKSGSELFREPVHLGTVGGGFVGHNHMNVCGVAKDAAEAVNHAVSTADHLWCVVRGAWCVGIYPVQPCSQTDAAGDGVQFRYAEAMFGDEQIRTDDARDFVLESGRALQRDEFSRFAEVEPLRNPSGHLTLGTFAIEEIDGAIELEQHAPERFDFLRQLGSERKRPGRNPPLLSSEQAILGKTVPDKTGLFRSLVNCHGGGDLHDSLREHRRAISSQRQK